VLPKIRLSTGCALRIGSRFQGWEPIGYQYEDLIRDWILLERTAMKKLMTFLAPLALIGFSVAATEQEKIGDRLQRAAEVLQQIMNAPDKGIPEEVLRRAKCIAVIPHEIKVGLTVGARVGKGVATCRTENGWSAPAFFTITGGSFSAQIGIEGVDNVLMIMNQRGMRRLLSAKFQIGADASAAAGPVGRHAAAGTDWKPETEILSYSRARGIFAGVSLDGAYVRPDRQAMRSHMAAT
jgi:lipid-binding SYLF domain-containing protein